jgi:hypothetical protein
MDHRLREAAVASFTAPLGLRMRRTAAFCTDFSVYGREHEVHRAPARCPNEWLVAFDL